MKCTNMCEPVFYNCIGLVRDRIKELLEEIMKVKIYDVEIKNTKLLKDYMLSKDKILDYLVLTNRGYVNVEINNYNTDWLIPRNVSYAGKILSNSVRKDGSYKSMGNVIQINLCRMGDTDQGIVEYTLRTNDIVRGYPEELTNVLKIIMVNVDFFKKMVYNGNKELIKDNYLLCLLDLTKEEIDKLPERNDKIMGIRETLESLNDDEDFVQWLNPADEYKKFQVTLMEDAKEQGMKEGQKLVAKNMLEKNMDIETIMQVTNLTKEEIESL